MRLPTSFTFYNLASRLTFCKVFRFLYAFDGAMSDQSRSFIINSFQLGLCVAFIRDEVQAQMREALNSICESLFVCQLGVSVWRVLASLFASVIL